MLSYARRHLKTAISAPRFYLGGLLRKLFSNPVPIWCQAIAFKVLVTLAPRILLGTGIFGLVLKQENPYERVAVYFRTFLPESQTEPLIRLMMDLQRSSGALTVLGSIAFVISVVTLFGTLRFVISSAMSTDRHVVRSRLQGFAFDLRMAAQVGMLFVLSFGVTFAVNTLQVQTTAWGMDAGLDPETLRRGWRFILRMTTLLVPWAISLAMFTQLFYFIPRPKPPLRSAAIGAAVTALLFEGAKNGFTLYARYSGRFFRYDATEGADALGSLQGVFLLILVFVFWAYVSALILIVGAMVASLHEQRHQPRRSAIRRLWRTIRQRRGNGKADAEASGTSPESLPANAVEDGAPTSANPAATPPATPALPPSRSTT